MTPAASAAEPEAGSPRYVAAVGRAVAILDALAEAGGPLGTNEVSRRTQINAATVSRILATLAAGELVEQVPETHRYRLGLRLAQLGSIALQGLGLRDLVRPHLEALAEETGETTTLSVPGEREAVTVDFVPSPQAVQSVIRVGRTSAAHATAVGKVYLAFGGTLPDSPLDAYTPRTITDREALARAVAEVAERGWAEAAGERDDALNAVAAPILGTAGELRAIIGVQGPAMRFDPARMRAALPGLVDRARRLAGASPDPAAT